MHRSDTTPPEVRLLAALARLRVGDAEAHAARAALAADPDTDRLLMLAERNRLTPLLYRGAKETGLDTALPVAAVHALRDRLRRELFPAARLDEAARDLLERFHAGGVPAILLRGPAVGEWVYGDPALRPYSDLDPRIARDHLPAVKTLLRGARPGTIAGAPTQGCPHA